MLASAQKTEQETDRGPSAAGGERFCALSREAKPADEMIRFVVGPGGEVIADVKRKLPGRGLWITGTRAALEQAIERKIFSRGFKRDVRVAADLAAATGSLLERAALDALAIVAKAGQVVAGFGKTEDALSSGEAIALIHAADAAADGRRKLDAILRKNDRQIPVIDAFSSGHLDLALGRLNVIHAALLAGPVSDTFLARTERFLRFRTGDSAKAADKHGLVEEN
jgi:predicted RNA-binding protein YlxR (DUF448 family)/ribosomal protein L30E